MKHLDFFLRMIFALTIGLFTLAACSDPESPEIDEPDVPPTPDVLLTLTLDEKLCNADTFAAHAEMGEHCSKYGIICFLRSSVDEFLAEYPSATLEELIPLQANYTEYSQSQTVKFSLQGTQPGEEYGIYALPYDRQGNYGKALAVYYIVPESTDPPAADMLLTLTLDEELCDWRTMAARAEMGEQCSKYIAMCFLRSAVDEFLAEYPSVTLEETILMQTHAWKEYRQSETLKFGGEGTSHIGEEYGIYVLPYDRQGNYGKALVVYYTYPEPYDKSLTISTETTEVTPAEVHFAYQLGGNPVRYAECLLPASHTYDEAGLLHLLRENLQPWDGSTTSGYSGLNPATKYIFCQLTEGANGYLSRVHQTPFTTSGEMEAGFDLAINDIGDFWIDIQISPRNGYEQTPYFFSIQPATIIANFNNDYVAITQEIFQANLDAGYTLESICDYLLYRGEQIRPIMPPFDPDTDYVAFALGFDGTQATTAATACEFRTKTRPALLEDDCTFEVTITPLNDGTNGYTASIIPSNTQTRWMATLTTVSDFRREYNSDKELLRQNIPFEIKSTSFNMQMSMSEYIEEFSHIGTMEKMDFISISPTELILFIYGVDSYGRVTTEIHEERFTPANPSDLTISMGIWLFRNTDLYNAGIYNEGVLSGEYTAMFHPDKYSEDVKYYTSLVTYTPDEEYSDEDIYNILSNNTFGECGLSSIVITGIPLNTSLDIYSVAADEWWNLGPIDRKRITLTEADVADIAEYGSWGKETRAQREYIMMEVVDFR